MSKYTTELRYLIETDYDLGLNDYEIFDDNYREVLNSKIIDHFYFREIGFETAGLFKNRLNERMRLIMPYYNELYKNQLKLINEDIIMNNTNLKETMERVVGGNSTGNSNSESKNNASNDTKNLYQDTPQNYLNTQQIDNINWATNVTYNKSVADSTINDKTNSSANFTNNENYVKMLIGNNGNNYNIDVLNRLKNNLMNIDEMIMNRLEDLFMGLW